MIKLIKQLQADAVEATKTRTLHMAQLTNTADEIDRAYQEFSRGTILGHGAALLGGNNYIIYQEDIVPPCIVHHFLGVAATVSTGIVLYTQGLVYRSCRSWSRCCGPRSRLERA